MKLRIYTRGYRPFVMGGSVHYLVGTRVNTTDPVDVGQGIQCCLVVAPNGKTFAVEAETGAIVGGTIDEVRADMADADPAVVSKQMEAARKADVKEVPPAEFWRLMRCGATP